MKIKKLRIQTGFTQKQLSEYLRIPIRTIQDWETEKRMPPDYLVELIEYKLANEHKI